MHVLFGQSNSSQCGSTKFFDSLIKTQNYGLTRDEVKFHFTNQPEDALNTKNNVFDYSMLRNTSVASQFAAMFNKVFTWFKTPLVTSNRMCDQIRAIPTVNLLDSFSKLPRNVLVVGPKNLTLAYSKQSLRSYTTATTSRVFQWHRIFDVIRDFLKRHATIGANIKVWHHTGRYLGEVQK